MGKIIDSDYMHSKFLNLYHQHYQCETMQDSIIKEENLFVDKSNIINEFNDSINQDFKKYVCITKPRGFGKTSISAMLVSYYSKSIDSKELFDKLKVSQGKSSTEKINKEERKRYVEFQSKYHTLYFDFSCRVDEYDILDEYLASINLLLKKDFEVLYPDSKISKKYGSTIYENLQRLFIERNEQFILIIDEWDYIITNNKFSSKERDRYLSFLKYLIKDQGYAFTYMTGVLPLSPSTEINCFRKYSMINDDKFYSYFGFTEREVRDLCKNSKAMTYEKLDHWYNGYKGPHGEKIFNTWSVCQALSHNKICNYWNEAGRVDEMKNLIDFNIRGIKDEILELIRGKKLSQRIWVYGAEDQQRESAKNEEKNEDIKKKILYSKMVTFGFLTYYHGKIFIPNQELLEIFKILLREEEGLKCYYDMIENSDEMVKATLNKDTKTIGKILEKTPMEKMILTDHNRILDFIFFNLRMKYELEEGKNDEEGTVDFIYYPKIKNETAIIVELKIDGSAKAAIKQIHKKKYYHHFKKNGYKGNILLVGISYKSQNKTYTCRIKEYNCNLKLLTTSKSSSKSLNKRKNTSNDEMFNKKIKK